jgi:hypothetical protein
VEWRADGHSADAALRALLERACHRAPEGELPRARAWLVAVADEEADAGDWAEGLAGLAEVQAWLARPATDQPELRAELAELLRSDYERERARLRTGMFTRPPA